MKKISSILLALVTLFTVLVTSAVASDWTVSRVSGPAKYTMDGKVWQDVRPGLKLPNAAWVNTGPRGKVQLRRGNDTIHIGSYTLISAYKKTAKRTQIRQNFGTVTIDVQKRNYDHMGVETPFMAAVVKGTKFTVSASRTDSGLSVSRGRVEVTDRRSGAKTDVNAGQRVSVGPQPTAKISVKSTYPNSQKIQPGLQSSSNGDTTAIVKILRGDVGNSPSSPGQEDKETGGSGDGKKDDDDDDDDD